MYYYQKSVIIFISINTDRWRNGFSLESSCRAAFA